MALVVVQSMADVSDSVCRYKCIQFTCFIEQSVLEQLQHREKETCLKLSSLFSTPNFTCLIMSCIVIDFFFFKSCTAPQALQPLTADLTRPFYSNFPYLKCVPHTRHLSCRYFLFILSVITFFSLTEDI